MPYDDVQKFSEAAVNKARLLKEHPGKYFLRAVMAGFFIVVAMIFSNVVGNTFQSTDPAWGKLLGGIVFAIAVLLIVFIGAELFTGNNLVMAFGAYDKKVSWAQVGKVWLVSYIGNFVGCLILSVIFVLAGASGTADYYAGFIGNKLSIPAGICFSGQSEPARHHLFVTQESEVPDFGFKYYRSLCSPKLQYLRDRFGYWYGLDSTGKPDGPLKAGIVVHICNAGGTRISEETTRQWKA